MIMLTSFSLKGQLELPTKCSLGKVKLETMLASDLDCSGSVGEAQVLKLKGLMTLQGSNCWGFIAQYQMWCFAFKLPCAYGQKSKLIRENVHKRNYRATVNYCDGYNLDT